MELQEHVPPLTNVVLAVGALDVCLILDELLVLEGFDTSPATATALGATFEPQPYRTATPAWTHHDAIDQGLPSPAGQEGFQRLQTELSSLKHEMSQLKQGYEEVKEQQENLGTTVTSLKERQAEEDDDVLEWWKDPGPQGPTLPIAVFAPGTAPKESEVQQQIQQILSLLQQQQEQQQQFMERQQNLDGMAVARVVAMVENISW
eukprot:g17757.t2